jgi:hypothetical protein
MTQSPPKPPDGAATSTSPLKALPDRGGDVLIALRKALECDEDVATPFHKGSVKMRPPNRGGDVHVALSQSPSRPGR